MARTLRISALLFTWLLLTGASCTANRGEFGTNACEEGQRGPVPAEAVLAVYFKNDGSVAGVNAEDLTGTENNKMCPAEPASSLPGACKAGYCSITIPSLGISYCKKLPC
ncbi:MAG TPA: hypothetical protein VH518_22260 [Tepidisphaeraceae bacterium]|jgi:hypothetical protein